jgi:hypothetical protein
VTLVGHRFVQQVGNESATLMPTDLIAHGDCRIELDHCRQRKQIGEMNLTALPEVSHEGQEG